MAALIDIYQNAAINNTTGFTGLNLYYGQFNNAIDGTQVNGVAGTGIGYNNWNYNVYKPTNPSYESSAIVGNIPYVGDQTYSAGSTVSPPNAGPYQGHY